MLLNDSIRIHRDGTSKIEEASIRNPANSPRDDDREYPNRERQTGSRAKKILFIA